MPERWTVESLTFTGHAIRQMFARGIAVDDVRVVVRLGETIAEYPDEKPYRCRLFLGTVAGRPLHVVLAYDSGSRKGYVVTVYEPDPNRWHEDMRTRKQP